MDIKLQDSLAESLRWRCKESASETAIKFLDRQQTYAQFDSNANRVAQGLLSFEIKPNSRVAYLAKNTDYFFEIFYGALKSKAVVVGVNWRLAAEEVAYVLEDSKSEILFVSPDFFEIIEEIENKLTFVKQIICLEGDNKNWMTYSLWKDNNDDIDPQLASDEDDDVIQLYTSGTTGHPKGVQLTNKNFYAATDNTIGVIPFPSG